MKKYLFLFLKSIVVITPVCLSLFVTAQVGIGTTTPNSSASLDVSSSNKGVLIPRLTTAQRNAITNPATGLLLFDTDKGSVMFFDGATWRTLSFTDESKTDPQSRAPQQSTTNGGFGTRVSISGNYA